MAGQSNPEDSGTRLGASVGTHRPTSRGIFSNMKIGHRDLLPGFATGHVNPVPSPDSTGEDAGGSVIHDARERRVDLAR